MTAARLIALIALAFAGLAGCRSSSDPWMAVLDIGAVGDEPVLLLESRSSDGHQVFRVGVRRSDGLQLSEPLGPTSLATNGTIWVNGNDIVVALSEKASAQAYTTWLAAVSRDSLHVRWVRRFDPGHWQPLLEVTADRVYTWAGGVIALDRATGETLWSRPYQETDSAHQLHSIGDSLYAERGDSFQILTKHGEIVTVASSSGVCREPDHLVSLAWGEGSKRLARTDLDTGLVKLAGPTDGRLDNFSPLRCLQVGARYLFLGRSHEGTVAPGAVMMSADGRVLWRADGPGHVGLAVSLTVLDRLPAGARYVPVATFADDVQQLAVLDLDRQRWTLTDQVVPIRHAVIPFDDCWVVAGRNRSTVVDPRTGQIVTSRSYPTSLWKQIDDYLWVVDERGKRATRFHACTLARMPL